MQNVYNDLMVDMKFNKFIVRDLLFVEYTCPVSDDIWGVWTQTDFIFHVLKGQKKFSTINNEWEINEGETYYVKKGSFWMTQYPEDDFCMFGFFITDDFIRSTVNDLYGKVAINLKGAFDEFSVLKVTHNPMMLGFFNSMVPFFSQEETPSSSLLELKLKELVTNILTTGNNPSLSSYFQAMVNTDRPGISSIMESNYYFNLSIAEFAELTQRSLSTFKREFNSIYNNTPGRWLLEKRLKRGAFLLREKALNVNQIAYQSGFENASHFSRTFKDEYGVSPSEFRNKLFQGE